MDHSSVRVVAFRTAFAFASLHPAPRSFPPEEEPHDMLSDETQPPANIQTDSSSEHGLRSLMVAFDCARSSDLQARQCAWQPRRFAELLLEPARGRSEEQLGAPMVSTSALNRDMTRSFTCGIM